ncbi:MAG: N-acetylmuramidase domain-containing protein [Caldilineaceae bacterium]
MTSDADAVVARVWNQQGQVILDGAETYGVDPVTLVAVVGAESASAGFGADGRLLIRFEVHLFYQFYGEDNQAFFDQFFRFNPDQPWRDHLWRSSTTAEWQAVHTSQQTEWAAFQFARSINEDGAIRATSMGSVQIMGFNFERAGYTTPQEMLLDFQSGEASQIGRFSVTWSLVGGWRRWLWMMWRPSPAATTVQASPSSTSRSSATRSRLRAALRLLGRWWSLRHCAACGTDALCGTSDLVVDSAQIQPGPHRARRRIRRGAVDPRSQVAAAEGWMRQ